MVRSFSQVFKLSSNAYFWKDPVINVFKESLPISGQYKNTIPECAKTEPGAITLQPVSQLWRPHSILDLFFFFKLIPINLLNFVLQLCQLKVSLCIHVKDPAQAAVICFFNLSCLAV